MLLDGFLSTGRTNVYVIVKTSAGLTFVPSTPTVPQSYNPSNRANYQIALTEGPTGYYSAPMPEGTPDDTYNYQVFLNILGTWAITDPLQGNGTLIIGAISGGGLTTDEVNALIGTAISNYDSNKRQTSNYSPVWPSRPL